MTHRLSITDLAPMYSIVETDLFERHLVYECVQIPMARAIARTVRKALGLPLLESAA